MPTSFTATDIQSQSLHQIAQIIREDWKSVYFGAVPYLDAMHQLQSVDGKYGLDDGREIVLYFLSNAQTWRGETARTVKAELKRRLK